MASLFKVGMDPDILSTSVLSTAVSLNIVCQYSMHLNFKGAKTQNQFRVPSFPDIFSADVTLVPVSFLHLPKVSSVRTCFTILLFALFSTVQHFFLNLSITVIELKRVHPPCK